MRVEVKEMQLPRQLSVILDSESLAKYRDAMIQSTRSCWRLEPERVGRLRVGLLGRMLGRRPEAPQLPRHASKIGGIPYLEAVADWPIASDGELMPFVAQINFAELPAVQSPAPRSGIYVLFFGPDKPYYHWRWYPNPAKAAEVTGPSLDKWESRLSVVPAVSVSSESWWNAEDLEGAFDRLCDWNASDGGHLGAWTEATLDSPGPRQWLGDDPAPGEKWLQLWTHSLEESYGSMETSVVVRLNDFESGNLDRCSVILWQ